MTLEAEGAPAAMSLLREASFDLVMVADEVRRLALQGLFVQLKKAQPPPLVFLLPMSGSDPAQLRSMAGGNSRLLDPEQSAQLQARALVLGLEGDTTPSEPPATRSIPPMAVTIPSMPPPPNPPSSPQVPSLAEPSPTVADRPSPMASTPVRPQMKAHPPTDPPMGRRELAPVPMPSPPPSPTPTQWAKGSAPRQITDPGITETPSVSPWALSTSGGLSDYARGVLVEGGRALDVVVAQRRGHPAVFLATPTAAMARDLDWTADLMRGATVAARIVHPSLPPIVDVGTAQNPFIASGYTPGLTLARLVKRLGELDHAFTPDGAATLVADLLGALEAVHDAKLMHGAISPRSIWVTEEGGVQLLHVGIAHLVHATERNMRGANLAAMSWEYETPESVTDGVVDSKSDLFAAGTVCWELIACDKLFARSDQMTTLDAVTEAEIPPLDVPRPIELCILKLLSRDPDQRPRSAAAARNELLQAMKEAKASGGRRASGSMMGRLFGKRAPESVTAKRLEGVDPWSERAGLVKLAMR